MVQIDLTEAKTQLSELVERAANGKEIVIAKAGKPARAWWPYGRRDGHARPVGGRDSCG